MNISSIKFRSPTFGDVPLYRPKKRPTPERVALSIPHTNEIPVSNPFRVAIEKKLGEEGIYCSTHINTNMIEDGWMVRLKVAVLDIPPSAVTVALSIEDYHGRISRMLDLSRDPKSQHIEIHAYQRSGRLDPFCDVYDWARLGRTDILILKDLPGYISSTLDWYASKVSWQAQEIARLRGFSLAGALKECREMVKELRHRKGRLLLAELPGEFVHIDPRHHMYEFYFKGGRLSTMSPDEYEMKYCAGVFEKEEAGPASIAAMMRLICGRPPA
jgi:hypothetical protein